MKKKLFIAKFTQRDGEYEYLHLEFVRGETLEAATEKARETLKTWWGDSEHGDGGGMCKVDDCPDTYEESPGYRMVTLDSVTEVKTLADAINYIGEIK